VAHFVPLCKYSQDISNSVLKANNEQFFVNITTAISFEEKNELLATSDMALKIAKKTNISFICFEKKLSLSEEYQKNLEIIKMIKKSIQEDNFLPVFQPIVDNHTLEQNKFESLMRMRSEDGKLITPFFFLDIAKKAKLYPSLAKILIKKIFDIFQSSQDEFSINLTSYDCTNLMMQQFIYKMLDEYKIGERVTFEIVESESIDNFFKVLEFIKNVKSYGCKIAIDDFGTGYSNFEYLLKLKADYIKIDGSMIREIDTNKEAQLVVSTIVDFAKKIGMKTVAEFVENESIFKTVKSLGIDYSQGYYFSVPVEKM
jgi:EAL domain-containing protein (putative c-di-GMP-specific phosphodiesterase class I)